MKKTKIYFGRDEIGRFTCDGRKYTKFQIQMFLAYRAFKRTMIAATVLVTAGWIMTAGMFYAKATLRPQIVNAKEVVEVPIDAPSPVMDRIAKCESGASHYKNGQVIIRPNVNGTVDIGYYQINSVHSKEATRMGFDLTKEDDNKAYGMYLYKTQGTEPCSASKSCWK